MAKPENWFHEAHMKEWLLCHLVKCWTDNCRASQFAGGGPEHIRARCARVEFIFIGYMKKEFQIIRVWFLTNLGLRIAVICT